MTITCRFAEGSQALGCHVELRIQSSIDMTMDISMHNESLEATSEIITLAHPLSCYNICAFDWESDGTRGELCVPVRVNESLSGSRHCPVLYSVLIHLSQVCQVSYICTFVGCK